MPPTETPTIDIGESLVIVKCPDGTTIETTGAYPPSPCPTVPPNPNPPTRPETFPTCEDVTDAGVCVPLASTGLDSDLFVACALAGIMVGVIILGVPRAWALRPKLRRRRKGEQEASS